jgi:hypothetical protein
MEGGIHGCITRNSGHNTNDGNGLTLRFHAGDAPMAASIPSHLHRQLTRVRRRLFIQSLWDSLVACWAVALILAAGWSLVEPHVLSDASSWLRWAVAGGLFGAAIIPAIIIAIWRRPTALETALSLDQRFGLKERITTSVSLSEAEKGSPAGSALLADVEERIAKLEVSGGYPFALRWTALLVPVCGGLLAVAALLYHPETSKAVPPESNDQPITNAAQIEKEMKKLEKKPREQKKGEKASPEAIQQFEDEMDKLTVKPRDNRKQVQELIKDATALEDKMMGRQRGLMEKREALKEQLQQMDRFEKQEKREGPAEDIQKALKDGDLNKAKEEIEKLAKKLEENKLNDKEKEQLQKQIEDVKDKIKRLTELDKQEEKLEELSRKDGAEGEEAKRQLDQLRKNKAKLEDNLKNLQDLADELQQCQQCLKQGKSGQAGQRLRQAADKLEKMTGEGEMEELEEQLNRLQKAKSAMCKGCQGGDKGEQGADGDQDQPGSNNPAQASGRRPESADGPTGKIDARSRAEMTKGELRIEGFEKGFNLKRPKKSSELVGEIKQASQEAPEAIDRMRIPKAVGDISKGYFENLRRDAEKETDDTKRDK